MIKYDDANNDADNVDDIDGDNVDVDAEQPMQ